MTDKKLAEIRKQCKTEAVKEFMEELDDFRIYSEDLNMMVIPCYRIDSLLKEMGLSSND